MPRLDASNLVHRLDRVRSLQLTPEELAEGWRGAVHDAPPNAAWNMYVHVPFCKSICTFCNYKRLRVSSREALDQYASFIAREAQAFAGALEGVTFGALYVGGGTPSVLAPDQLDRMLAGIHDAFDFHPRAQKNFEYDPMVMTAERFAVIERFGFTRYSFGIQSVDVEVNNLHNRGPQGRAHVSKQFELLSRHGAESVNVDFLLGLDGTTWKQILDEIEETLRTHRPDEVTVYFVTPTPAYLKARFEGRIERFAEHMAPFELHAPDALRTIADQHDYEITTTGRHVVVMRNLRRSGGEARSVQDYCDIPSQIHRPLYLLGLGDSARSRIFGRMRYRAEHDDEDLKRQSPRYVGTAVDLRDEMFAYLVLTWRDGAFVSRPRFLQTFGVDVVHAYPDAIAKLRELGAVTVDEERVTLATQGARARLRDTLFFLSRARRRDLARLNP